MPDLMTPGSCRRLSRFLALMLRHRPSQFGLALDAEGFVPLEDVLRALWRHGHGYATQRHIEETIATSDKRRYEIRGNDIRAVYGHSTDRDIEYPPAIPPDVLYHGTTNQALDTILVEGLDPMNRQYVHLSATVSLAGLVGRRRQGDPVILELNARHAHEEGVTFFQVDQDIWLIKHLPAKYITSYYSASHKE